MTLNTECSYSIALVLTLELLVFMKKEMKLYLCNLQSSVLSC